MVVHMYAILNNTFSVDTSYVRSPHSFCSAILTLRPRCMSNQLGVLRTQYPYDVLFPKSCDLSLKPPASCVPASILRCVAVLTLNRRTVAKDSDEGITRPPAAAPATSETNSTGISSASIAGVVIGSFAFGILITFIAYLFWRRRHMAQAADPQLKVEESSVGGMNYPMPWAAQNDGNSVTTSSPPPRRQKDGQYYQTPPMRYEDSGDAHRSRQSPSAEGTSRSPPSYLAATSYAGSG